MAFNGTVCRLDCGSLHRDVRHPSDYLCAHRLTGAGLSRVEPLYPPKRSPTCGLGRRFIPDVGAGDGRQHCPVLGWHCSDGARLATDSPGPRRTGNRRHLQPRAPPSIPGPLYGYYSPAHSMAHHYLGSDGAGTLLELYPPGAA